MKVLGDAEQFLTLSVVTGGRGIREYMLLSDITLAHGLTKQPVISILILLLRLCPYL